MVPDQCPFNRHFGETWQAYIIRFKVPIDDVSIVYRQWIFRCLVTRVFNHQMSNRGIGMEVKELCQKGAVLNGV
ncbi:MAG: hypothetical protein JWQ71_1067 [Pedosphaera sp.]|nr:hypothetical protein [Pedosphaera sp.]